MWLGVAGRRWPLATSKAPSWATGEPKNPAECNRSAEAAVTAGDLGGRAEIAVALSVDSVADGPRQAAARCGKLRTVLHP